MTEKLTPLPWFAFNIADYITDTLRLQTESHGAYLLLTLDYYGKGEPCPDDDFILAAVAKLPEERWKQHRKALAPFFDIRDGYWFHKRIEREMREASVKHSESIARATSASHARWGKQGDKTAPPAPKQPRDTAAGQKRPLRNPQRNAPSIPEAKPEQSPENPHLHTHPSITEGGGEPPASDQDLGIGTPVPKDFLPSAETNDRARAAGMTDEDIDAEVRKFIGAQQANGSFSHDWHGSFAVWIEREISHRKKLAAKAAPRIEVNSRYVPTEKEWQEAIKNFKRDESSWPRWAGNNPGSKCPPDILEKNGWDAKLMRFMAPEKTS